MTKSRAALLILASLLPTFLKAQSYSGPRCLGPYCLDRKLSQDDLFDRIGAPGTSPWYYRSADNSQILYVIQSANFLVGGLVLRDSSYLKPSEVKSLTPTKEKLSAWKTTEGIRLGSSEEDVRTAYGKPSGETEVLSRSRVTPSETKRLYYKGRLNKGAMAAVFDVRNGKVSSIDLETDAFLGPDCLGIFCAYEDYSLRILVARLGPPPKNASRDGDYCYQLQGATAFLHAKTGDENPQMVNTLLLSDFPNCGRSTPQSTENDLRAWMTPEGIGLGSLEADVRKAYGKPSQEDKLDANTCCEYMLKSRRAGDKTLDIGNKRFYYQGRELERAEIGIRNGKVSYIMLCDSE